MGHTHTHTQTSPQFLHTRETSIHASCGWRKQNRPQRIKLNLFKRRVNAELTLPTAELASRKRERGCATLHWLWDWPGDRGVNWDGDTVDRISFYYISAL